MVNEIYFIYLSLYVYFHSIFLLCKIELLNICHTVLHKQTGFLSTL